MLRAGKGQHLLHGATAACAAAAASPPLPAPNFGLRGRGAIGLPASGPNNIHVAHLIIDSAFDTALGSPTPRAALGQGGASIIRPADAAGLGAASYWQLYQQRAQRLDL